MCAILLNSLAAVTIGAVFVAADAAVAVVCCGEQRNVTFLLPYLKVIHMSFSILSCFAYNLFCIKIDVEFNSSTVY